ncbi:MAG: copper-binding protein [Mesorhizobium sp.]
MNRIASSAAALLALMGTAYAAEIEGVVQTVDPSTRQITLDTGQSFTAPEDAVLDEMAPGDKIRVTVDDSSGAATAIEEIM